MDVVFSAPFSGAVYKWLADCMRADGKLDGPDFPTEGSGYYPRAFRGAAESRPQALASLVMLDEIYLAAGDFAAPDDMRSGTGRSTGGRFGPSLGVTIGPNLHHDAYQHLGSPEDIQALAREPEFEGLFPGMNDEEIHFEIVGAVADSMLIGSLGRPLVCGRQRRQVVNALLDTGVITQSIIFADESPLAGMHGDPISRGERIDDVVKDYSELAGLEFDAPTIDVLAKVKDDTWVRESAEAFQSMLTGTATADTRAELEDGLRSALSTRKFANPTGRILDLSALTLSVASVIPALSGPAGAVSLALPAAAAPLSTLKSRASWFEIGPRMTYAASIAQMEDRARKRGAGEN